MSFGSMEEALGLAHDAGGPPRQIPKTQFQTINKIVCALPKCNTEREYLDAKRENWFYCNGEVARGTKYSSLCGWYCSAHCAMLAFSHAINSLFINAPSSGRKEDAPMVEIDGLPEGMRVIP